MKICKKCGIKAPGGICPSCGEPLPKQQSKVASGVYLVVATVLVAFIIGAYVFMIDMGKTIDEAERRLAPRKPTSTGVTTFTKDLAWHVCKDFVKAGLKAPKTAKFPGLWERGETQVLESGPTKYRLKVASYVDAQNAFGAMVRTPFT